MSAFSPIEKSLWLHKVCEANFARLNQLIPGLEHVGDRLTAEVPGKPALHLRLIERSPFTLVLELTHDFNGGFALLAEPAVRLRVCLDARTVEMLSDTARPGVHEALRQAPEPEAVLDYKWSLNYFLARWLEHCLSGRYRFGASTPEAEALPTLMSA
jgi:uncharacterized protein YqiB (DUF1249 family)